MSEKQDKNFETLLPAARVAVFSSDSKTHKTVNAIADDWRFARVQFGVVEGDVAAAIDAYQNEDTPDLIIIQSDDVDESFTDALETLAELCDDGTTALVIGPKNDVNLYRSLIDMGVEDYLVRPVKPDVLSEAVGRILLEQVGAGGSQLIAYVGAKGGMGASVLAQAAAWGAADILDQKTIFLDAAGGWSTASVGMGFEPLATLSEAARAAANDDEDSLVRMMHKASDNLHVLASGGEAMLDAPVGAKAFEKLLDTLMVKYPVVIADLSGASSKLQKAIIARAHHIHVVSTPTLPSLRLARAFTQEVKTVRGGSEDSLSLVINMQGLSAAHEVKGSDIAKVMEMTPSAVIPFDPKVFLAGESEGRKITQSKDGKAILEQSILPSLRAILSIKDTGAPSAKTGFLDGLFGAAKKDKR